MFEAHEQHPVIRPVYIVNETNKILLLRAFCTEHSFKNKLKLKSQPDLQLVWALF